MDEKTTESVRVRHVRRQCAAATSDCTLRTATSPRNTWNERRDRIMDRMIGRSGKEEKARKVEDFYMSLFSGLFFCSFALLLFCSFALFIFLIW